MSLAHFPAMLLFALVISVSFAFLSKQTARDRFFYAAWSFLAFLLVALVIAWMMFPFPRR